MAEKQRVEWIDVAKGIGILLVIIGHMIVKPIRANTLYSVYTCVYFFHMPFMFYLSGRTFGMAIKRYEKQQNHEFVLKKTKQMVVPYVVYDILVYMMFLILNCNEKIKSALESAEYGSLSMNQLMNELLHGKLKEVWQLLKPFMKGLLIGDNQYAYHLWFIYGLFCMNILSYFVIKYVKRYASLMLIVLSVFVALVRVYDVPFYVNTTYWGAFNTLMKCYFWFVIGTYVDLSKYCKKVLCIILEICSFVYMCLVAFGYKGWAYNSGLLWFETLKWIADLGLIMLFILLAQLLCGKIKSFFSYTGKKSFGIYLFHQPFFATGLGTMLVKMLNIPVWTILCVVLLACYLVPLGIMKLLDTKYLSFLKPYFLGTPRKKRV
ncbi:MAG: acyltransferase family protein [Lachnospiraceae bacterium]|nr:acyltransferase family protein [Lachnospiraceae bacterium]